MAAGRGEFFRSLREGIERKPGLPTPTVQQRTSGAGQPGPGRISEGPNRGQSGVRRKETQPRPEQRPINGTERSFYPRLPILSEDFSRREYCLLQENLLERLPSEILTKILSYLDASSLFAISYVSKLFHQLANDDFMWQKIYMSEFGSRTWKPKLAEGVMAKEDPVDDRSAGRWKKMYVRAVTGQQMKKWNKELKNINPCTGLPQATELILRNMNVNWELILCDRFGRESTLEQSRAYFSESSVIVCWSEGGFFKYHHIRNLQLYGVRKETFRSPKVRKPAWRSLILKLDVKAHPHHLVGKDRLIRAFLLPPGIIFGIWRGHTRVAFIMVSLHFHKLVEKSLLGSPACPFSELEDPPPVDFSDPDFGLHGYTLRVVMHNTSTLIMSGYFRQLSCHRVQIQHGLVELRVINRTNLSQHRSLSGSVKLPWKSNELEGAVENCCIMTLTLLDMFQKPFWCVSSPIYITMAKRSDPSGYGGDHFLMEYRDSDGQVKMKLVWLKEQKQFFVISLTVYVSALKVNKHFSRQF